VLAPDDIECFGLERDDVKRVVQMTALVACPGFRTDFA
jgi:hypothetical protein